MGRITQVQLRRLAARALRVLERHQERQPALKAFVGSLDLDAKAFIEAYDTVVSGTSARKRRREGGEESTKELVHKMRMWFAHLAKDIPTFERSAYLARPTVVDDVISDTERLLSAVEEHQNATGGALAYGDMLKEDIEAALEAVLAAYGSHANNRSEYALALKRAREMAKAFHAELVAFRHTLGSELGRSHPDYLMLRSSAKQQGDGEDDEVSDDLPLDESFEEDPAPSEGDSNDDVVSDAASTDDEGPSSAEKPSSPTLEEDSSAAAE